MLFLAADHQCIHFTSPFCLVCSFVNCEEGGDSVRYLHAYCYMHRLFLQFLSTHPALVSSARETLKGFIADPTKRHIDVSRSM